MQVLPRKQAAGGGCVMYLAAGIFIAAGFAMFIYLTVLPVGEWIVARGWPAVPCTIERSEVARHDTTDGTTYRIDITYGYTWDGVEYQGDRYDLLALPSPVRAGKEAVVSRYPVGSRQECYVNPDDPAESVLNVAFSSTYLLGCLGLLFVVPVLGILYLGSRKRRERSLSRGGAHGMAVTQATPAERGRVELKGGNNSRVGFAVLVVMALIWNGILWGMLYDRGFAGLDWFTALFMTPFALVGIALIAGAVYFFLALFNPKPDLTLEPGQVPLGETAILGWFLRGNASRIARLTITLCGEEKVTYRRGTKRLTKTQGFKRMVLVETDVPGEMQRGEVKFDMPEFTAPSFDSPHNNIVWSMKVHGDIRRWPDVNETFVFPVLPLPRERAAAPEPAVFDPIDSEVPPGLMLQLNQDPASLVPGQVIDGVAGWRLDEAKRPVLRLMWYTSGRGTQSMVIVEQLDLPDERPACRGAFRFTVPEFPYSFKGSLITVHWAIEMLVNGGQQAERVNLVVSPWVEQVRLEAAE